LGASSEPARVEMVLRAPSDDLRRTVYDDGGGGEELEEAESVGVGGMTRQGGGMERA
jgi:hypothetical protein